MADPIKERDNKDAEESGRPVQLDPEEQSGKEGRPRGPEHGVKPDRPVEQPHHDR